MKATFAQRLQEALERKGMKAAELARLTDTPESVISQYKKGEYVPKQRRLEKFSKVLGVSIPYLMGDTSEADPLYGQKEKPTTETGDELTDEIIETAKLIEALPPERREVVLQLLRNLADGSKS